MGLWDYFKRKKDESPAPVPQEELEEKKRAVPPVYSGMRVEVTDAGGRLLFVAKLVNLRGDRGELNQYSETTLAQDQEPLQVHIRGYHDQERRAVYMEGVISPMPNRTWKVEELSVTRIANDRAFFRLDTDLPASATTFSGLNAGEHPCRLLNISVGGACVASERIYHRDDKFLLKVRLLENREPSAIFCQVLRIIEKDDGRRMYGCRFLELNEADQDRITENIFAAQRQKRSGGK